MKREKKCRNVGFSTILWAVMVILLCALPCKAQDYEEIVEGENTVRNIPAVGLEEENIPGDVLVKLGGTLNLLEGGVINGNVVVESGGTLNLNGGEINGTVGVYNTCTFNLKGGYVQLDVYAADGSFMNIMGGAIGGNGFWDITVEATATITVFGTLFNVFNGTYDPPEPYFIPNPGYPPCQLTGQYGGDAGTIDLMFYTIASGVHINLAEPSTSIEVQIDIKPGSYPNSINLDSQGVVPVAILSTADPEFDATLIEADKVFLAGAGVAVRGKGDKALAHEEDVNGDGLMDLVLKVETENLDPGTFQDGYAILEVREDPVDPESVIYWGTDEITIVPPTTE